METAKGQFVEDLELLQDGEYLQVRSETNARVSSPTGVKTQVTTKTMIAPMTLASMVLRIVIEDLDVSRLCTRTSGRFFSPAADPK